MWAAARAGSFNATPRPPRRPGHQPRRVCQITVPADASAFSTLPRITYGDAFLVETGPDEDRTPLQWARAIVANAPILFRLTAPIGWFALGLKHGRPRSDELVLGWSVRKSNSELALLGADSRVGMPAELLIKPGAGNLLFATLVQHENAVVRAAWAGFSPGHRLVVQHVLEQLR